MYLQTVISKTLKNPKSYAITVKKPGHVIRDWHKRMKKEQEQKNDPSFPNTNPPTSKTFALCPHCQQTNLPPVKCWSAPNAANRPKRFKKDQIPENAKEWPEQGNSTHSGPKSILKNLLNCKNLDSNRQITHQ